MTFWFLCTFLMVAGFDEHHPGTLRYTYATVGNETNVKCLPILPKQQKTKLIGTVYNFDMRC